jgi:phosphonate transport system substrate-binding protein
VRDLNYTTWIKVLILTAFTLLAGRGVIAKDNSPDRCAEYDHITFGILPFVSAEQLVISFSPLTQYLSKHLNVPVRIETAPTFSEFARRTYEEQRYDILFTAPHLFPEAKRRAGYRLIVSVDSPRMWAVIVVPDDSPIHNVKDLIGKRLATVPPTGLATLLARKYLLQNGINPDTDLTMVETPTHDASLLSSYLKVTDASVLMQPPYKTASPQIRKHMRIIARTDSAPHIPISVSPGISITCSGEIAAVLLNMGATTEGKKVLSHNSFSGFKMTGPEEYEKLRALLVR